MQCFFFSTQFSIYSLFSCTLSNDIQWNLRITDILGVGPLSVGVLILEGAIELYFTAILSIVCYNINVISTQTAIIACYIL